MPRTSKPTRGELETKKQHAAEEKQVPGRLSLPGYISMVGVHSTLLIFAGLFLPKTAILQELAQYDAKTMVLSSLDRPQDPFLDDLTRSPTITMFSLCAGALILQTWWAVWLKRSWMNTVTHDSLEDKLRESNPSVGKRAKVCPTAYQLSQPLNRRTLGIGEGPRSPGGVLRFAALRIDPFWSADCKVMF